LALEWKSVYASMHAQNEAAFPPAGLHYVLQLSRGLYRAHSRDVAPAELLEEFRKQTRRDFGPLLPTVLEDWGLKGSENLGKAVSLLGRYGCLTLEPGDTVEAFAALENPA
jgi:uncharacterized repeat protein (TIGR04138 family)